MCLLEQVAGAAPPQGLSTVGGGYQAPAQPSYGDGGGGSTVPMYSAIGQPNGRAPPPSGAQTASLSTASDCRRS